MTHTFNPSVDPLSKSHIDLSFSFAEIKGNHERKTDDEIIVIVRPILEEVKQSVLSSHDIIPYWDCPELPLNLVQPFYQKYGESILALINLGIERDENCHRIAEASGLLSATETFRHPQTAEIIATARFGKGECVEAAHLLSLKCNLVGLETILIGISSNQNVKACSIADKTHLFMLLGIDKESLGIISKQRNTFLQALQSLKQGVLADPFLNVLCTLKNLSSEGKDFLRYIELTKTFYVINIREVSEEFFQLAPQIEKDSLKIYQLAKNLKGNLPLGIPLSIRSLARYQAKEIVLGFLFNDIHLELQKISKTLGITLPWKANRKNFRFWIEGSQKEINSIREQMQGLGMVFSFGQIKKTELKQNDLFALFLEEPTLSQLREINSQLKTKAMKRVD